MQKQIRKIQVNPIGANSVYISINNIQGFYKSRMGETYIEIFGQEPLAVRDSIQEINNKINKRR